MHYIYGCDKVPKAQSTLWDWPISSHMHSQRILIFTASPGFITDYSIKLFKTLDYSTIIAVHNLFGRELEVKMVPVKKLEKNLKV